MGTAKAGNAALEAYIVDQLEEEVTALAEGPFITLEGLKSWDKGNCLSTPRDHWPVEAQSTEALHKCGKAFMKWKLKPTAENAAALAAARKMFRQALEGEFCETGIPVSAAIEATGPAPAGGAAA
jgi:hypothetical protein